MIKLANLMVYCCCIVYIATDWYKKSTICRNYKFELLMQKHCRAYSAREFRKKC